MFANSPLLKSEEHEVQGADASILEWRVGLALDKLELGYLFQYQLFGGHAKRGGVIIDFLVLTSPLSTPLEVMGEYWHRSAHSSEDRLKESLIRQKGNFAEVIYLWESELQTISDANSAVRRELRV